MITILRIFLIILILFNPIRVKAYFDNFNETTSLDNYTVDLNGGTVDVLLGNLVLSAPNTSLSYPYVRLKSELLGDVVKEIEISFKYHTIGRFGAGIVIDDNYPSNGSGYDTGHNSLLWTWNWEEPPTAKVGWFNFNYLVLNNQTQFHKIRIVKSTSSYLVYLDDVFLGNVQSEKELKAIWFGSTEITNSTDNWPTIFIDSVRVSNISSFEFPYFSQQDAAWGKDEYDHANTWGAEGERDIERWGCALTSAAMVLKNYEIKNATDSAVVNPGLLNTWLKNEPDGYVRGGLLNWLAVTRFAKNSRTSGNAPTALEFERAPYNIDYVSNFLTNNTPVILGEPGHFVTAYESTADSYKLADPNDATRSSALKIESFISANVFKKSDTDLSYFLFARDQGLEFEMKNSVHETIPLWFQKEFPSNTLETAYYAKPVAGKFTLYLKSPGMKRSVDIYFYDKLGDQIQEVIDLEADQNVVYEFVYNPENVSELSFSKLDTSPPPTPKLLNPPDGAYLKATGLILDWEDVADTEGFVNYNYRSSWIGGSYGPVSTGTNSQIDASGSGDNTYSWQVQACDSANNCSEWSTARVIHIDSTPPNTPVITFPTEEQYFHASPISNNWTAASDNFGIKQYRVEYEYDDHHTFPDYPYRITNTNSRMHAPSLAEQGGVKFRVQASDVAGNESDWSTWRHYYYDATPPSNPGIPTSSRYITNSLIQNWVWSPSIDNLDMAGYYSRVLDATTLTSSDWYWLGDVLRTSTNMVDGKWQLQIKSIDSAGNASGIVSSEIMTVDTQAPTTPKLLGFRDPDLSCASYTNQRIVTVDWSDSDDTQGVAGYEYHIDYPLANGVGRGTWVTNFVNSQYRGQLNIGTHSIKVRAYDNANNYSPWSNSCEITHDIVPPTSVILFPDSTISPSTIYSNNWDGKIAGSASDEVSGIAKVMLSIQRISDNRFWDGNAWVAGTEKLIRIQAVGEESWKYILPNPIEDEYTIISHAVDRAGNIENSYQLTLVLDRTIPQVTVTTNPEMPGEYSGWFSNKPSVILTSTDKYLKIIEYRWDSSETWQKYEMQLQIPNEGHHKLYYRAQDLAGNVSEIGVKNLKWDSSKLIHGPKIVGMELSSDKMNAEIKWSPADDVAGVIRYEVQWWKDPAYKITESVSADNYKFLIYQLTRGRWTVVVRAFDGAGNSEEDSQILSIDEKIDNQVLGVSKISNSPNPVIKKNHVAKPANIGSVLGEMSDNESESVQQEYENVSEGNKETNKKNWYLTGLASIILVFIYLYRKYNSRTKR